VMMTVHSTRTSFSIVSHLSAHIWNTLNASCFVVGRSHIHSWLCEFTSQV
jgi:hypothetical protein